MPATAAPAGQFFYVLEDRLDILFVDDDPILREFAQVHLSTDTVTLNVAEDGLDALEKLAHTTPDLMLLDLEMPNMDGFQLLEQLDKAGRLQAFPVIVVTGREDVAAIDRAYRAGATSFVVKPLNWRQLSYQIRYVHRTFCTEHAMIAERDQARGEAEKATAQARAVLRESQDFLATAVSRHPDLRGDAARYAQVLSATL
jgi:DNA-binding response OmpR family regulator